MLKKDLLLSAALGAALVSFSGAALAQGSQMDQPSQSQMEQPSSPGAPGTGGPAGASPETTPGSGGPAGAAPEATTPGGPAGDSAGALNAKEGMDVVNAKGEKIGEVERIEGDQVIVSVGGFLGIGAHDVALEKDQLQSMGTGDDAKLQTSMTAEELKSLPEAPAARSGGATGGAGSGGAGGSMPEREGGSPPPTEGAPAR